MVDLLLVTGTSLIASVLVGGLVMAIFAAFDRAKARERSRVQPPAGRAAGEPDLLRLLTQRSPAPQAEAREEPSRPAMR